MIRRLKIAINNKVTDKLVYNTSEFYSEEQDRTITVYTIKKAIRGKARKKKYIELFHSTSQIQIVLFLRDYWYQLNNIPLPTNNETWNKIRESIKEN
jgi:hypothetical protein